MYQERELAGIAFEDIQKISKDRIELLTAIGALVRVSETYGPSPRIKLEVLFDDTVGWQEYIESSYTRGVPAYDDEYLRGLLTCGWIALHFPAALINERFSALKTEDLEEKASRAGVPLPEVWVYLYHKGGPETRAE